MSTPAGVRNRALPSVLSAPMTKVVRTALLALVLLGAAAHEARAWGVGGQVVVVAPAPMPWYPYAYYGYAPVLYPPGYAPGWVNGYGFESHVPGEWATSAHWESTGPHVHGYTLH